MAKLKKTSSRSSVPCLADGPTSLVDTNLGRIIAHKEPERGDKPELTEAARILADEARRREARFEQSVEAEKTRGDALARRFEEALPPGERGARDEAAEGLRSGLMTSSAPLDVFRQFGPAITAWIVSPRFISVRFAERTVLIRQRCSRSFDQLIRRCGQSSRTRSTFHTFFSDNRQSYRRARADRRPRRP